MPELTAFFFRDHQTDDLPSLGLGVTNLELLLGDVDYEAERSADRAFELGDLADSDVAGIARPDEPITDCVDVAVTYHSRHSIDLHAALFVETDQVPAQKATERYDRTFTAGEPDCFLDGDCPRLSTSNDIRRANPLYSVDYVMPKEIAWLELVDAEGAPLGRRALTARSWLDQSWVADNGQTELVQSYTIEVWIERDDATTTRFEANFTETFVPGVTDEGTIRSTVRMGVDEAFEKNDDAISDLFGDGA